MPSKDSDHDGRIDDRSRRTFLLGVGAAAALAGCLGGGDVGETADGGNTETPTPDSDGATATPEPTTDGDGDTEREYGLSRAESRELLPPESLALRYEPALGNSLPEFWVAVVGETDAAAVRAEAASGGYNQVTPQDGTIEGYLGVPVQVDPNGDEVTVFAVDGDGARGPVMTSTVPTDDLTDKTAAEAVPPEALSFTYEQPGGDFGSLTIEVTEETDAQTLIGQPTEAPGTFADRVGNLADESRIGPGTTLDVAVDPDGDEVMISASVDGATGQVANWQVPDQ